MGCDIQLGQIESSLRRDFMSLTGGRFQTSGTIVYLHS